MPENVLGNAMLLKYKVGGVLDGGAWTTLTKVKDVTASGTWGETDAGTRDDGDDDCVEPTVMMRELSVELVFKMGDANLVALRDAWLAKDIVGFKREDPDGDYVQSDFKIYSFQESEPRKEVVTVSISAKQCSPSNYSDSY